MPIILNYQESITMNKLDRYEELFEQLWDKTNQIEITQKQLDDFQWGKIREDEQK